MNRAHTVRGSLPRISDGSKPASSLWIATYALAGAAILLTYALGGSWIEDYSEPLVIGTVVVALAIQIRARGSTERRFWLWILVSHLAYLSIFVSKADWTGESAMAIGLLEDFFLLMFYVAVFFAIVTNPHLRERSGDWRRRIEMRGAVIFALALIAYFILIPGAIGTDGSESYAPQIFAYVILDVGVALTLAHRSRICESIGWRNTYRLLAVTHGCWAAVDLYEALMVCDVLPYVEAGLADVIWYTPHLFTLLALRVNRSDPVASKSETLEPTQSSERNIGFSAPLTAFLVLLPAMHFGLYGAGILDPASRQVREIWILISLGSLAILAVLGQRRQIREHILFMERHRQSQKMDAIGRLAGGIAHDFNNVLTVIIGQTDLVLDELRPSDPVRGDVESIAEAGGRAKELVSRLAAISSQQTVDCQTFDLNTLVESNCALLRRVLREDIEIRFEPDVDAKPVHADRAQLERVLLNLALNAKDAMPTGGSLVFETTVENDPSLSTDDPKGRRVVLTVRDTGTGMDADTLQRAFDPFFSTKDSKHGTGLGLGLTTAYAIIEQNGGKIAVSSTPGRGTTFTIHLPRSDERVDAPARAVDRDDARAPGGDGGGELILVVDDQPTVAQTVRTILQRAGYRVLLAEDANSARELMTAHADQVSLLLTDVVMPGESGPELFASLAKALPELKVLFMTGYSPKNQLPDRRDRDPAVISKPFEAAEICAAIRRVLDDKARSVGPRYG